MWIYLLALLSALPLSTGTVVYYAENWDWRQIAANQHVTIPPGLTPIATPSCADLGRTGYLSLNGTRVIPVVIADCASPEDLETIRSRKIIAEVPYPTARQYRFLAEGKTAGRLWLRSTSGQTRAGKPPAVTTRPIAAAKSWPAIPATSTD